MSSPRRFIFKHNSIRRLLPGFFSDHHKYQEGEIEDDWELVGVFKEFSIAGGEDASGDDQASDVSDMSDHLPSPWLQFQTPIKLTILNKAEVCQLLDDKITTVCTIIALSKAEATILLHHFKWSVDRTQDEWLGREERVRRAVGLFERPVVDPLDTEERACGICLGNFLGHMLLAVSCGHQFCRSCWTGYISEAISDGPICLALRCPDPSCDAAVGRDMVELLSSEEDKKKFENYLLTSYLKSCKEAKWCPAPGCEYAVFSSGSGDIDDFNVTCRCLFKFCWNCANEAHSPVDCGKVVEWTRESSAQSENWVLANTKPCPNCKFPAQLDGGLCYLLCANCSHEFCSDCGVGWSAHDIGRGVGDDDFHADESLRPDGFRYDDDRERSIVKKNLERYSHYYGRWTINESSRANAITELKLFQDAWLEMMGGILGLSVNELGFFIRAQLQVIECRQFLKWTYVYGYFLNEDEHTKAQLLEFMQEQAEDLVRLLHQHVEELKDLVLQGDLSLARLPDFRNNLVQLTGVARIHFNKMEAALKAGLSEVVCIPRPKPKLNNNPRRTRRLKSVLEEESSDNEQSTSPMTLG